MGKEFLSGYATLAEGEKDPRNLMAAFAIARVVLIEFDIADHIEVCFTSEIVSRWQTLPNSLYSHCLTSPFAIFPFRSDSR